MVFQDYALFPHLSVGKNVAFGLPRNAANREARVASALTTVGLADLGDRTPDQLSGGQQQRVALARALAPEPEVILLDEPFSNLDADLRASVREEVRQILREAGTTAVLVTHDQEEALSIADRVAVMLDGQIVQAGSPEELYHRPATRAIADFIGDVQFVPGEASGRRATTVLGDIPLHGPFDGPVDVMLRPEMLRLAPVGRRRRGHTRDHRLPRLLRPRPTAHAPARQWPDAQGAAGRVRRIPSRRPGERERPWWSAGVSSRGIAASGAILTVTHSCVPRLDRCTRVAERRYHANERTHQARGNRHGRRPHISPMRGR